MTNIFYAIRDKSLEQIKKAIENGADVNEDREYGSTPLIFAAYEGHLDVIKCLVENGADVNEARESGFTPLITAALKGHLDVIGYLVGNGAEVDKADNNGTTPIHIAAQNGRLEVVNLLLENGAKIDNANNHYKTPLNIALEKNHSQIAELFRQNGADNKKADISYWEKTCKNIFDAIKNNNLKNLQKAIKDGGGDGINHIINDEKYGLNYKGHTPLLFAIKEGNLKIVEFLLQNGAEVDRIVERDNPLHYATKKGNLELIKLLFSHGADVNKTLGDEKLTPLGRAAEYGHLEVVKYLVAEGADVNKAKQGGFTPLLRAAYQDHLEVVEFLLKNGANINEDIIYENRDIVKDPLIIAVYKGELDKVEHLCKNYANSHIYIKDNLRRAVKIGRVEMVKCLLDNGAEVDKANNIRYTLLHLAAQKGHPDIVRLLFDYGADSTVFIDKEKTNLFRTIYVASFDTYSDNVKKVIREISTNQAILKRDNDPKFLDLQMKRKIKQELDQIQKPEIKKLKEELKSYLDPYDDNWRDSFYDLTTFFSDNSLPSFTKEDIDQLFEDKTFKSILLLNHTDSIVDKYKVIERKEIFKIAKAEYNISDDDEKKYEEYEKQYKTDNGMDIKHVINDMLKIKISAPPREEPPKTIKISAPPREEPSQTLAVPASFSLSSSGLRQRPAAQP